MNRISLRKYLPFTKSAMLISMSYKVSILIWMTGGILTAVVTVLLWHAIFEFNATGVIGGYTFDRMLVYVVAATATGWMLSSESFSELAWAVRNGEIGMRLLKPTSYRLQLYFLSLGSALFSTLFVALPLLVGGMAIAWLGYGFVLPAWWQILLFFGSCMIGHVIMDATQFLFGVATFRTQAGFGMFQIMTAVISFLSGAAVPLSIFPNWAQNILACTPFPSLASAPIQLLLGQCTDPVDILRLFGISLMWAVVLNLLGALLFRRMVKHVVVFGG